MKIVVDIPDEEYESYALAITFGMGSVAIRRILGGTPLPKGHGELIDRKNVIDVIDWYRLNPQHFSIDNVIDDIKCMEFLVEADKEGSGSDAVD